ncbi:hypothetical protein CU044_5136 [Streptomyces sp. L-9-10]|nr:hypothetical protein CU044_5136 [Streptomyces sp. L-9-10]
MPFDEWRRRPVNEKGPSHRRGRRADSDRISVIRLRRD